MDVRLIQDVLRARARVRLGICIGLRAGWKDGSFIDTKNARPGEDLRHEAVGLDLDILHSYILHRRISVYIAGLCRKTDQTNATVP